jgi:hypothetical protein
VTPGTPTTPTLPAKPATTPKPKIKRRRKIAKRKAS